MKGVIILAKEPIKKAKNGTYYFRANLGYDSNGKQIQKYMSGFKTKKVALEEYSKLILYEEDDIKNVEMNFKEYIDTIFICWYKSQVTERTFLQRLNLVTKHFGYFDKFLVSEIQPIHVQRWQLKLLGKYSASYVRGIQGLFSIAMSRAVVLGICKDNPSKIVGNVKKQKIRIDFWTKEEFEKVVSVMYLDDYFQHYAFITITLLFMTGIRVGELTALQWDDLDINTGVIKVTKSLYYRSLENFQFVEPKTKAGIRNIVLDKNTLQYLLKWKICQQNIFGNNFIISANGMPSNKWAIARMIDRFSALAGVHRIKIHGLRHSHASLLISIGENPLVIKERLGHEDIELHLVLMVIYILVVILK